MQVINDLLNGKRSPAIAQFFCGEYFVKLIQGEKLEQLKGLVYKSQQKSFSKLSKKNQAKFPLLLKSRLSSFFSTSELTFFKQEIESLQKEILKGWGIHDEYFGVSIDWHEVLKSAFECSAITHTQADFDNLVSLQDIPNYWSTNKKPDRHWSGLNIESK